MTYKELLNTLLSNDIYEEIKNNEEELFKLIPELKICKAFNQNNKWNIYDVYEHILHVLKGTKNNKHLRLAALFHDIGKPITYKEDDNGIGHFYNHWNISVEIFDKYKDKFNLSNEDISLIKIYIYYFY